MEIKKMEVVRETEKQLTYIIKKGYSGLEYQHREAKKSEYQNWFDTFEEAVSFLLWKAENEREELLERLANKQAQIEKISNLKE
jgi:ribulose bisphosphate carboxylase small subunit